LWIRLLNLSRNSYEYVIKAKITILITIPKRVESGFGTGIGTIIPDLDPTRPETPEPQHWFQELQGTKKYGNY
jgi:hypothetical protein